MAVIDTNTLSEILAESAGITAEEASQFLESFASVIAEHVANGEDVEVQGMGTFVVIDTKQAAMRRVALILSDVMKEEVNSPFSFFEPYVIAKGVPKAKPQEAEDNAITEEGTSDEPVSEAAGDVDEKEETSQEEAPEEEAGTDIDENKAVEEPVAADMAADSKKPAKWVAAIAILLAIIATAVFYALKMTGEDKPSVPAYSPVVAVIPDTVVSDTIQVIEDTVALRQEFENLMLDTLGNPVTVEVAEGDMLTLISERYFGSKAFWPYVYWVNRDVLKSPSTVLAGQILKLPSIEYFNIDAKDLASRQKATELGMELLKE